MGSRERQFRVEGGEGVNRRAFAYGLVFVLAWAFGICGAQAATSTETVYITLDMPPYIEIEVASSKNVAIPPTWTFVENFVYEGWKSLRNVMVSEKVTVSDHLRVRSNVQAWHISASVINKDHYSLAPVKILAGVKAVGISGSYQEHGMLLLSENEARTLFNRWWGGTGVTRFDAEYQAVVDLGGVLAEPPRGTITILYTVTSD